MSFLADLFPEALHSDPLTSSPMKEVIRATTMTFRCSTCWDDEIDINSVVACPDGHITCVGCVNRGVASAISENTTFVCPAPGILKAPCCKPFNDTALSRALPEKLKEAHDVIESQSMFSRTQNAFSGDDIVVRCPLCAAALLLSKETAACIGFDEATKIKCRFCEDHYCKKCNKKWHDGPCDPIARADDDMVTDLAIVCICGSRFIRGDGCNRIKCNRCSRSWCWVCKHYFRPNEQAYADHYWQPTDRDKDQDKCPLYGDRPEGQVFAKPPVPPRKAGRGIASKPVEVTADLSDIANQSIDPNTAVPRSAPEAPRSAPASKLVIRTQRASKRREVEGMCREITNRGTRCQRRGKANGMCGIHARVHMLKERIP